MHSALAPGTTKFLSFYVDNFLAREWADGEKNRETFFSWLSSDSNKELRRNTLFFDFPLTHEEKDRHTQMAKKRSTDFGYTFVNYNPDDAAKAKIKETAENMDDYLAVLEVVHLDNLKVSLNWDDRSKCFGAYVTDKRDGKNDGLLLSTKHTNPIVAVVIALYFHVEISEGDWSKHVVDTSEFDW